MNIQRIGNLELRLHAKGHGEIVLWRSAIRWEVVSYFEEGKWHNLRGRHKQDGVKVSHLRRLKSLGTKKIPDALAEHRNAAE
jgi:hypothetical protein